MAGRPARPLRRRALLRESASLDLVAALEDAGFEEVDGRAIGNQGYPYPYVVTARKPG